MSRLTGPLYDRHYIVCERAAYTACGLRVTSMLRATEPKLVDCPTCLESEEYLAQSMENSLKLSEPLNPGFGFYRNGS